MQKGFAKHVFCSLLFAIGIVHLFGMIFIPIMDVDASQYASISREMMESGNYLQVMHRGADYLDKPPFLFWVSALSFKLFGVSSFVYRLPSFLFTLLGVFATYRLAKMYYNTLAAQLAAIILFSTQAMLLISHDVRTDTILTATVIVAIWQILLFIRGNKIVNLLLAFTAIAIAMMEKGPIGLMVPVLALGSELLYQRNWKAIFNPYWLLGIAWMAILLIPMCWGLYQQFDAQPEKIINGVKGESGLKFFFWTQSFGRITGENVWKDNTTAFFFVHNFAWAFLPWTVLAIGALWSKIKKLALNKLTYNPNLEVLTFFGFLLPFIILSLSHYKLPHYIFVIFPFAALFTGQYLSELNLEAIKRFATVQFILGILFNVFAALILFWVFPISKILATSFILISLALNLYFFTKKRGMPKLILPVVCSFLLANTVMSLRFYPEVLQYQAGSKVVDWIEKERIDKSSLRFYKLNSHAMDFYCETIIPELDESTLNEHKTLWIFTNETGRAALQEMGLSLAFEKELPAIAVTKLTGKFLNPTTRVAACGKNFLIRVN